MTNLERFHADLRAPVQPSGRDPEELNFGRADSRVLAALQRVLRDAHGVAFNNAIIGLAYRAVIASTALALLQNPAKQSSVGCPLHIKRIRLAAFRLAGYMKC